MGTERPMTLLTTDEHLKAVKTTLWDVGREQVAEDGAFPRASVIGLRGPEGCSAACPAQHRVEMMRRVIHEIQADVVLTMYDGYITLFSREEQSCPSCLGCGCRECHGHGRARLSRTDALIMVTIFRDGRTDVEWVSYAKTQNGFVCSETVEKVVEVETQAWMPHYRGIFDGAGAPEGEVTCTLH